MAVLLKRNLRRAAVGVSAVALALGLTATPAAAHSLQTAVTASAGCNWDANYRVLESSDIRASGDLIGRVYLLWNGAGTKSGHNCVVTRKLGPAHGSAGYTAAALAVQGRGSVTDDGQYSHYAAATKWARGNCVKYMGWVQHPDTGVTRSGGDDSWKYCDG